VDDQYCWSDDEHAILTIGEPSYFETSVILPIDTALFPRRFMVAASERGCTNVQKFSREREDIEFEVQLRKHTFV
jgi:hypothetical protein